VKVISIVFETVLPAEGYCERTSSEGTHWGLIHVIKLTMAMMQRLMQREIKPGIS
jgi:hypothetical protein